MYVVHVYEIQLIVKLTTSFKRLWLIQTNLTQGPQTDVQGGHERAQSPKYFHNYKALVRKSA